jgi:uncharacterized protein YbjT (DUF2867 family)
VKDNLADVEQLADGPRGCSTAYYLIHSMVATGKKHAVEDDNLARNFARAASLAGVERVIYLGGLGGLEDGLSDHLRSRRDVERALASSGVPITILRAAMVIGSVSAWFEILSHLVERLPTMVTPRRVQTESQEVAIAFVLFWLFGSRQTRELDSED